jgi:3-phenylpropionate/cinnamic acid dioxygenase small subunit
LRVQRVRTGVAHAEEPPSRVRHFVSNVRILEAEGTAVNMMREYNYTQIRELEGNDDSGRDRRTSA